MCLKELAAREVVLEFGHNRFKMLAARAPSAAKSEPRRGFRGREKYERLRHEKRKANGADYLSPGLGNPLGHIAALSLTSVSLGRVLPCSGCRQVFL